jgi:hypothetical protein
MKYFRIVALLICLVADGCIEPLDITIDNSQPKIVVDGMMSNEPGPYYVSIVHSRNNKEFLKDAQPVTNASVVIVEDDDVVYPMVEIQAGKYQTSTNWQGKIGSTYELRIVKNENEYHSSPQTLTAPGVIDAIYAEFEPNAVSFGDDGEQEVDAFKILIDAHGADAESDRLRWRFIGVYHATTYPQLNTLMTKNGDLIPNPLPCSGYVRDGDGIRKVGDCYCCDCWPTEYGNTVLLSSPEVASNGAYKRVDLMKIPITPLRFINKYKVEIEQLSLSPELFRYWKLVKAQQEAAGNLFQPNAVKVRGNMISTKDNEEILGIFSVNGITRGSIYIDPSMIPGSLTPDFRADACKNLFPIATDKPSIWP